MSENVPVADVSLNSLLSHLLFKNPHFTILQKKAMSFALPQFHYAALTQGIKKGPLELLVTEKFGGVVFVLFLLFRVSYMGYGNSQTRG